MNSTFDNDEQIKKLERLEKVYNDDRNAEESKIEQATEEPPFSAARKFANIGLGVVFIIAVLSILTGTIEMYVVLALLLIAIAVVCAFQIPVFVYKKKKADTVIAILVSIGLILAAMYMFIGNNRH